MDIQGYIVDYWWSKVSDTSPVLAVYDRENRYHELMPIAAEKGFNIIDTTMQPLRAFQALADAWEALKEDPEVRILIYRGSSRPKTDEDKRFEPFQAIIQTGVVFPEGANDTFLNICHRFLPSKVADLNLLDRQGILLFDNINNLQEGASYPALETLTNGRSLQEIVIGLLRLGESVTSLSWLQEWRRLVNTHFPGIKSDGSLTLAEVQERMWQYLLFSEFALDLPEALPESLLTVARADNAQQTSIYDINRRIRDSIDMRDYYVEAAEKVARNLNLERLFARAEDLGEIVTFAFENRVEYDRFVKMIELRDIEGAAQMAKKNRKGIWYSADREVQSFWDLAMTSVEMFLAIDGGVKPVTHRDELIEWYASDGYKADFAMRRFLTLYKQTSYHQPQVNKLADLVGNAYRNFSERGVKLYQELCVAKNPASVDIQQNDTAFNHYILPRINQDKRVVMIMVDAFRYEMGKDFAQSIRSRFSDVKCTAAMAYIPTVTKYGMAALLPDAIARLELKPVEGKLMPFIDNKLTDTPDKRIERIRESLGNVVVEDVLLDNFNADRIANDTRLLVIRSIKIDSAGENCGSQGLGTMDLEIRNLARVLEDVRRIGFNEAYIFADHGYMLQPNTFSGDKVEKPSGNDIVLSKVRCIAGNLNDSESSITFSPEQLGINADVPRIAFAKGFGVYEAGQIYFHEGLSLQENIVPIISVTLAKEKKKKINATYSLKYKGRKDGTVRIHRPMIEIYVGTDQLLSDDTMRLKMLIRNAAGAEVGQPVESDYFDETSQTLTVPCSETIKQPIELNDGLVGDIVISILDPETNMTLDSIILNTDLN